MTQSIRHQILDRMVEVFQGVKEPEWPIQFSMVELGPLADENHRKRFSIGIVPGPEKYSDTFPFIVRNLRVAIEFRVTVNRDDPAPGQLAEQVLTVIERVVIANRDWGGLAVETKFQDNEIDMPTYGDKTVMGVLWVEVQYRHHHLDPRNPNPGP